MIKKKVVVKPSSKKEMPEKKGKFNFAEFIKSKNKKKC